MIHRIAVALVAMMAIVTFAPSATADVPYAFAVQPVGCTPGYVQINFNEGESWTLDGEPVAVGAPHTRTEFPRGFQGAAHTEGSTYYLTVNPVHPICHEQPGASFFDLADQVLTLTAYVDGYIQENADLKRETRKQARLIDRQEQTIKRLRARLFR